MSQRSWYAVRVRPQQELIAAQSLRSRGLEEFLPLYESRRRWSDRVKVVNLPLLAGYVFCRFYLEQKTTVLHAAGCVQVVSFGPQPAAVPEEDIDALKRLMESRSASPCPYVSEGARVRIRSGAFKDMEGYVHKIKNQNELIISLQLLQRSVSVQIEADAIQPL